MAETLELLSTDKVNGIAVICLCGDGVSKTAYWNMGLQEKAVAEQEIRFDTIDDMIMSNADRYFPDDLMGCENDSEEE
jgi:hypothetical protein